MLQIRDVPDDVHRQLKARAALAGMSLSQFALRELERVARQPTRAEVLERLAALPEGRFKPSPTEMVRRERDSRARR